MLTNKDCWVPDCIYFDDYNGDFKAYETVLYRVFVSDFIDSKPCFQGLPVHIRKHPMENDKEEAFFHITCNDYLHVRDRSPDFRRCERIKWCRLFIENYPCKGYDCIDCEGLHVWEEKYRGKLQTCILSEEYRYMVILEPRDTYYLLVSAYYIERDRTLDKKLDNYDNALRKIQ